MRRGFIFLLFLFISYCSIGQTISPSGTVNICTGETQMLTVQGIGQGETILWQKDGVDIAGANKEDYTATTSGDYRVKLTDGKFTGVVKVVINSYPITDFTSSFILDQCSNELVTFTNTSTGAATYLWDFGDLTSGIENNTSTQKDPKHTFIGLTGNATQSFTIKLQATSAAGNCITEKSMTIKPRQIPDGTMGGTGAGNFRDNRYFKICGNVPSGEFTFSNQSSTPATNVDYRINWGDGSPDFFGTSYATLKNTYSIGTHKIVLTINGQNGCKSTNDYYAYVGTNPAVGLANPGNTAVCSGEALTFPITETANNMPGTIYTLTFTDGSPAKEYIHPAVPTFEKHVFEITSCGKFSSDGNRIYPNSFSASIQASNPCASSAATIVPIYVTEKPKADFIISPKDTICVNTKVTFTNTSKRNIVDNGDCYNGNSIWSITPSTGWTMTSGIFGDDFNSNIPSIWKTGSDQLVINFTQPGVYSIRLKTGSDFCGINEVVKTVCVNLPPTGSFTLDKNIGCGPLTVSTTTTSSTPTCGNVRYNWAVKYEGLPGCAPGEGKFTFVSGTSLSSQNPVIQFTDPGIYSLGLTIFNPGNACSTVVASEKIIVKSKPVIQVNGIVPEICQNNFISPKVNTACSKESPPTYLWTFDGGLPASSTDADPGKISYDSAGKFAIKLIVTNDCGTDTYSSFITVNPMPALTIPPDLALCNGSLSGSINFTSIPAGSAITWTNNNPGIGLGYSGASGTIASFPAVNNTQSPVKALINVLSTLGSCTDKGFMEIAIYPRPQIPIGSNVDYCQNEAAIPLKAVASAGNTLLWYSIASGGVGVENAPIPNTSTVGSFNYYVSQVSILGNCESNRRLVTANIKPIPKITSHTAVDPDRCGANTGKIVLKGLTAGTTYEVFYKQDNSPKSLTLKTNSSGDLEINNLPKGRYTGMYVQLNGCISASIPDMELVDPTRPEKPVIITVDPVCSGSNLVLSATSTTPGVSYVWTTPTGNTINQKDPVISSVSIPGDAGNYSVVVTKDGCTSESASVNAIIHPTPEIPVVSVQTICSGNTLELKSTTSFAGALNYSWTGPGGFTSTDKNPVRVNALTGFSGEYTLITTSVIGVCVSEKASVIAVIDQTPVIEIESSTDPTECKSNTGSIILKGLEPNKPYSVSYKKDGIVKTDNLTSDTNGQIILNNLSAGKYENIYVTNNGCKSNELGTIELSDPNPPQKPTAIKDTALCAGSNLTLIATSSESGVSYSWRGPNGYLNNSASPVISNLQIINAGSYFVKVMKDNCSSEEEEVVITINELPSPPSRIPVSYCINTPAVPLSVTGNNILWYTDMIGDDASTVAPVPSTLAAGTKEYYMSQTDINKCESARGTLIVTVHPNSVADFTPITPVSCPPFVIGTGNIDLKKYPAINNEYFWYADDVLIGKGDFPGYTIEEADKSVVIKLKTISAFGCRADSISHTFSTFKVPKPSFTLSVNDGCGPLTVKIENGTQGISYYNYLWNFGNGQTSDKEHPDDVVFMPNPKSGDTTYYVSLKIFTDCEVMEKILPVHVKAKPIALFTPTITEGCSPMKVIFKNTSKGLNTTYHWDFGDGGIYDTNIPEDVQHTFYAGTSTDYTVRLTATNECGVDYSEFIITVAPNSIKLNFAMNGPDHFGCQPHTVNFFNNSSGASAYFWDFGDGNFKSTILGVETVTHTYLIPGKYEVKMTASNICSDTTTTDYVTVYPKPTAAFTADRYTSCKGDEVTFTNQSELGTSYLWSFGDGAISTLAEPTHLYIVPGIYTVRLTVYKLNGPGSTCTEFIEKQVQVVETLPGTFTMSDSKADCAPLTVTVENENLPSVTAVWDFGDGTSGSGDRVIHTYNYSGTYTVTLNSTSPGGCIYVTTKTVEVNGPSGTLKYAGGSSCSPSRVRLEAIATNTNTYKWDFGDGTLLTTSNGVVFHEYAKPGTYLPSVALLNNAGCNYFIKGKDSIKIDTVDAGFISVQNRKCGITNLVLTDTSHVFFGIKSVQWNFGDGIIKEGKTVSHEYTISGKYWIEVIVAGNSGCTQIVRRQVDVQVFNIPTVAIIADASKCTNQSVLFRSVVQSEDVLNIYKWSISNGVTGTGENFNYTFVKPGIYTVDLTVSTVNNCSATTSHMIEIKPSPVIKASGDVTICLGNSIQLNASGAVQYQWAPLQSLSCNTCANPIATPGISTPYIVEGTNSIGCPGYDTVNVTVIQPLEMTSSGNDSICIGQSTNLMVGGAASYKWIPTQTLSSSTIANPVATPAITTGYRVVGYDGHNCFTDTAFIIVAVGKYPTVDLGPDKTLPTGTILPLVSTYTEGPMKDWKWTPTTDLDCVGCAVPNAHIKKDITYALEVTSIYGCKASDTISIKVFCENTQVFIPNAFSPDGDGINDVLMVRGKGIASVKSFRIFNRWGQLVFERNNFPPNEPAYGWDGKVGGKVGPPEVYVYTAEVLCENGVPFIYKGNTTIIK